MASKKGVVMYYDILEQLEDFSDEQFGKMTRAIIKYDKTGEITEFDDPTLKVAFKILKPTLDRNKQEYQEKCEKNRQNALSKWSKEQEDDFESDGLTLKQKNDKLRKQRLKEANEKGTHTQQDWLKMKDFFNNSCVRCGKTDCEIVKDHITPIYMGGSNALSNIQPLCRSCNSSKGSDTTDYREIYCKNNNISNIYSAANADDCSSWLAIATDKDKDIDKEKDNDIEKDIFLYWNSKGIIEHKKINNDIHKSIEKALKTYTVDEIKTYIDRYKMVIDDKSFFFDYKWKLNEFLSRKEGISAFADDGSKWNSYLSQRKPKNIIQEKNAEYMEKYAGRLVRDDTELF